MHKSVLSKDGIVCEGYEYFKPTMYKYTKMLTKHEYGRIIRA